MFAPIFDGARDTPNLARFRSLDPAAEDVVALLRGEAGRDPYDRALTDLIGELTTRSEVFLTWWANHNVRLHRSGVKHLHHPVVAELSLGYESMELTDGQGLRINLYSAGPGSPDREKLDVRAS
ncbi:MAG TPA: hypothetical protein VN408_07080 [Actinoplanes sp.]|nr:hypothetical protein [Actinoplanes sp.]